MLTDQAVSPSAVEADSEAAAGTPASRQGQVKADIHKANQREARILLDQLRCVDKVRLGKKTGKNDEKAWHTVLLEMLA